MLSIIRSAATSVRATTATRLAVTQFATHARRPYGTNNDDADKTKKDKEAATSKTSEAQTASETPAGSDLAKQLAEKEKKLKELQDAYVRCLADQENLRERTRKEIASAQEYAIQKFAKDLLESVDILGMALASVPEELRSKEVASNSDIVKEVDKLMDQLVNLYTGVSMTEAELVKTLQRHGVEQHNPDGEAFDPNKHQALFQTPLPDKPVGTVFSVQKLGYTLKGRVLRPAQVGVVSEPQ